MEKFTRKYTGNIDGKCINDYYTSQSDLDLETYEDRLKRVIEILNIDDDGFSNDKFLSEIFEIEEGTVVNVHVNKNQLWSESNVCEVLESLGTFLLNASDIKTDNKIYDTNGELKLHNKEQNLLKLKGNTTELIKTNETDGAFKPVIMLDEESYKGNYKKSKKLELSENDYKKYPELKDYENYKRWLRYIHDDKNARDELANKINIKQRYSSGKLIYKTRHIRSKLKDDMLLYKEHIIQPIRFKAPLKDSGCPSWDELDMFDEDIVYNLLPLKIEPNDLQDDLYWIIKDLDELITRCKFTEKQKYILDSYRDGMPISIIAKDCGINDSAVVKSIKSCVKIIINQYEKEYSDWYYLNICKGEYKTCKECGEVKLISEFNKNGQYYRNVCRECSNAK